MIQITEPTAIAAVIPSIPVLPELLIANVAIRRVAIAIPETGLLELPTRPTIREDTVAKKNPKTTMIHAPRRVTGIAGTIQMINTIAITPRRMNCIGRSCAVLSVLVFLLPFMLFMESRNDQRQGFDQGNDTTCCDSTCADIFNISRPDR